MKVCFVLIFTELNQKATTWCILVGRFPFKSIQTWYIATWQIGLKPPFFSSGSRRNQIKTKKGKIKNCFRFDGRIQNYLCVAYLCVGSVMRWEKWSSKWFELFAHFLRWIWALFLKDCKDNIFQMSSFCKVWKYLVIVYHKVKYRNSDFTASKMKFFRFHILVSSRTLILN